MRIATKPLACAINRAYCTGPAKMFLLYSEQFGSVTTRGGRLMIHGVFNSKTSAENAIPEVKKALKYDEDDPDFFFGVEACDSDKVYGDGIVKERLSKSSIYD